MNIFAYSMIQNIKPVYNEAYVEVLLTDQGTNDIMINEDGENEILSETYVLLDENGIGLSSEDNSVLISD